MQARRDSNPQHADLESAALPLELLAFIISLLCFFMKLMRTTFCTKLFKLQGTNLTFFGNYLGIVAHFTLRTGQMRNYAIFCHKHPIFMEPATGVEPVTSPLPRECSATELRGLALLLFPVIYQSFLL